MDLFLQIKILTIVRNVDNCCKIENVVRFQDNFNYLQKQITNFWFLFLKVEKNEAKWENPSTLKGI